jgi:nucleoside-diphosphate-sugar epimerase
MKILLSGGSGFIGRNLLNYLEKNNKDNKILVIGRNLETISNKLVSYVKLDLNEVENNFNKLKKFNPDIFLHLAWEDIPNYSEEVSKKNYANTFKIMNLIINETSCFKIISTGSCWEYNDGNFIGKCKEDFITTPLKPFSKYKNKIFSEISKIAEKKNIIFNWLRLFYVYGPQQKKNSIIPMLIDTIRYDKKIDIHFPSNQNDFIYIDDVVKVIANFLYKNNSSGIYNVGTGKTIAIHKLLQMIDFEINNNFSKSKKYLEQIDINKSNQNFYACTRKLKKHFNNLDFMDIRDGIKKLLSTS